MKQKKLLKKLKRINKKIFSEGIKYNINGVYAPEWIEKKYILSKLNYYNE